MMPQVNRKAALGCLTAMIVFMLVTTYITTSSLNPLAVYSSDSIIAKIIVSLFAVSLGATLLQLLAISLMRLQIRLTAGKPADNLVCPGCGLPLMPYISSHGQPIMCRNCGAWWHNGPACYSKGLAQRVTVIPTTACPKCRQATSQCQDLFGDLDDLVK